MTEICEHCDGARGTHEDWCDDAATVDSWKAEIESMTLVELLASFGGSPHVYDPDTRRCTCGALDHPDWGVTA